MLASPRDEIPANGSNDCEEYDEKLHSGSHSGSEEVARWEDAGFWIAASFLYC
jgi:hypothetical protein